MTKEELMQISAKSGLTYLDGSTRADFNEDISEQLTEFANAILERAAAVCINCCDEGSIRALKIEEGE